VPVALAAPELSTTATPAVDELRFTFERVRVDLSLKCPVAVKCCEVPKATLGIAGEIVIELAVAFVTVS
jgi:hypothetical protein